jgi:hypothetical protein
LAGTCLPDRFQFEVLFGEGEKSTGVGAHRNVAALDFDSRKSSVTLLARA